MKKVYLETFGCQMNVSDSERVSTVLARDGFEMTGDQLDADVVIVAGVSDVLVNLREVFAEGPAGVDHSELGGLPAQLASTHVEVPDGLGDQEVVVLDFSVEVVGRDVEEGLAAIEVEVHAVALGNSGLPGGVVLVGVEWVHSIAPGILKPLDFSVILFLAHGDDQVLILDHTAISQHNLVILGIELLDSDVV